MTCYVSSGTLNTTNSTQLTDKKYPTKNWKIRTLDEFLQKLRTIGSINTLSRLTSKCASYTSF